jgi:hypothetical protein
MNSLKSKISTASFRLSYFKNLNYSDIENRSMSTVDQNAQNLSNAFSYSVWQEIS